MIQTKNDAAAVHNIGDYVIKIIGGAMKGNRGASQQERRDIGRLQRGRHWFSMTNLVSRVHCKLSWEENKWTIEDIESTNGTWMVGRGSQARP